MVELETKLTASGVLYIPKEIRQCFGRTMKIVPNATAALFFPSHATYTDVLASLNIIRQDIEHRLRMQQRAAPAPNRKEPAETRSLGNRRMKSTPVSAPNPGRYHSAPFLPPCRRTRPAPRPVRRPANLPGSPEAPAGEHP